MESHQEFWIWTIESGWSWSGCSTTSADSWIDSCGDGENAAVKDDAAIVYHVFVTDEFYLPKNSGMISYLKLYLIFKQILNLKIKINILD